MNNDLTINFRSPIFDAFFIFFIPLLAIITTVIIVYFPDYFLFILYLNLSLLGYHHVISTFTRLNRSNLSKKEFQFLVYLLPPIIIFLTLLCAVADQAWLIPTIYLHWQWWHYTRQSEGVCKSIRFKTQSLEVGAERLNRVLFYLVPVATFLVMSSRQHATFLMMPVHTLPIPSFVAEMFLYSTGILWSIWFVIQVNGLMKKKISLSHFVYLLSHYAIYLVAYVLVSDITIGWLAINIWHNLQYISFVWHVNTNQFKKGIDKNYLIMSWVSQSTFQHVFIYFSACLILTAIFYRAVDVSISFLTQYSQLPIFMIAYQAINFHHYVVDTYIWKIRKSSLRKTL